MPSICLPFDRSSSRLPRHLAEGPRVAVSRIGQFAPGFKRPAGLQRRRDSSDGGPDQPRQTPRQERIGNDVRRAAQTWGASRRVKSSWRPEKPHGPKRLDRCAKSVPRELPSTKTSSLQRHSQHRPWDRATLPRCVSSKIRGKRIAAFASPLGDRRAPAVQTGAKKPRDKGCRALKKKEQLPGRFSCFT